MPAYKTPSDFVLVDGDGKNLSSFYICIHQVTQKEYMSIMGENFSFSKGKNLPVEAVSWYDAIDYCNKRSRKEGLEEVYRQVGAEWQYSPNKNGYRLLTVSEWKFAASGGTKSKGYKYAGSNNIDEVAWYLNNSGQKTHPVMQKKANELGIYDMSGNVREWVWDGNEPNPIVRGYLGGSFCDDAKNCELANLYFGEPIYAYSDVGFRLVRSFI